MSIRRPPYDQQPIDSDAALTARWDSYLEPEPFRFRALWLLFIDPAGRPAGPVITIDDVPDGPYDMSSDDLVTLCRNILDGPGGGGPDGGGSVALLMSRTGVGPWTVSDRAWGRFLQRAADEIGGRQWPVHRAHRRTLEEFVLPERAGSLAPGGSQEHAS
ncbi:hypothetical protein EFK50_05215 [Nocardioides marmoriginsengisoli]|uniref:Uncharacterized protein n=1 Tax=Nocardioides marmoriginsengisoli TaxID=661483 RepID=A0A3N0CPU4_9ACTN|nr:hypothetical protein [Nocardioides marmoriginsengisoli]RNL65359.1 hypothetical protein EFK50_05215 [Nocardioides marmoriginsengisoli]